MAKVFRLIPFGCWPANWGMTGKRKELAKAEYYWSGEDLERKLLDINYEPDSSEYKFELAKIDKKYNQIGEEDFARAMIEFDPKIDDTTRARELCKHKHRFGKITAEELEYELLDVAYPNHTAEEYLRAKLRLDLRFRTIDEEQYDREILLITYPDTESEDAVKALARHDLKHGKITQEEYDHRLLDLEFTDHESIDYKLRQLDLEKKHGNLSQNEWEKQSATLIGEPWFNIVGADTRGGTNGNSLAIELDWNEFFPRFLEAQGWTGHSDDEIVDRWFDEAMRQMVDPGLTEEQLDAMEDDDYLPSRSSSRRETGDDGLAEYS